MNSNKLTGYPGTRKGGYNPTPRPPPLLFPLFGLWTLKRLAARGARLCNRNVGRYLQFCMWLEVYQWSRTAVLWRDLRRPAVKFKCMSLMNVLCMSPSHRVDEIISFYFLSTRSRQWPRSVQNAIFRRRPLKATSSPRRD